MKVSVIIPAYNAENYVATAIESCLNQTWPPSEVIVVDDASEDRTADIAGSYPSPVQVIRLVDNLGVSGARNRGIAASTGDWIALLDADDWFLPSKLELQCRYAASNPKSTLIYTGSKYIPVDGPECVVDAYPLDKLQDELRYRPPFHTSTVLIRRDVFEEIGGFDPAFRLGEDWEFWLRYLACYSVSGFGAVPGPVGIYRMLTGSLSSNPFKLFYKREEIVESRCLCGLSGPTRLAWRRKIRAFLHFDVSVALREVGCQKDLGFILKSIALWPFPTGPVSWKRYKVVMVMLQQHLVRWIRNNG